MRFVLVFHRYLGLAVGLLMALWCLSGFVMMYQAMPYLTPEERLAGLEPLSLDDCCDLSRVGIPDDEAVRGFRIEMLLGEPVLRLESAGGREILSLRTGESLGTLSNDQVLQVARRFGEGRGIDGRPVRIGLTGGDQWTMQSARQNAPSHHIRFDGPGGHEIYVSGRTGEVFQDSSGRERLIAWFGAIPHWLYFQSLRSNGPLWTQIVIWSSVIGVFLTVTGVYVGISRLRRYRNGRWSPFRGWWYWHHMLGLVFGVLTLTWVFSGLLTMNPWGVLDWSRPAFASNLAGEARWGEVKRFVEAASRERPDGPDVRQLRSATFGGRLFVASVTPEGVVDRLNAEARSQPLTRPELVEALDGVPHAAEDFRLMTREDAYYYGHRRQVDLPVYRVILDDEEATRLYIDPRDGRVARIVDRDARISRWLRTGLHDLDFPVLRSRPFWYLAVGLLLLGVTAVCVTGSWMALQRAGRDMKSLARGAARLSARLRRRPAPAE